jgi:hypothetical protein
MGRNLKRYFKKLRRLEEAYKESQSPLRADQALMTVIRLINN